MNSLREVFLTWYIRAIIRSTDVSLGYTNLHSNFRWHVPEFFNMAQACSVRWAAQTKTAKRTAISVYTPGAKAHAYTYAQLQEKANRLSNALHAQGVQRGDRVAIVMPQRFETAVAYIAVLQMGAVAMPLSMLFGPEALEYRLQNSEAVVAIADASALDHLQSARATCTDLRSVIGVGSTDATQGRADMNYGLLLGSESNVFQWVKTKAQDPAVLIYTSGTTGNPKGALIPHRALIGNLTGFVCSQNWFGFDAKANASSDAVFWSPADWAWTGGLMDALLPTLYLGCTIIAFAGRFTPQLALELMGKCSVTHTFLFPTAIKAMMKAYPGSQATTVQAQFGLRLQACMSAGEAMGDAVFAYCEQQMGVTPNEMFGQTEINYIVGNCSIHWPPKPGSMGMGYPGHRVAVIDEMGNECPSGVAGDVALNRFDIHGQPDPIFFLGYWKNEAATRDKFTGAAGADDWCRTGDLAIRDADGYLWYQGRSDDVFKSAGYRIGPGEIENCLVKHPAVANAAVVPKPDAERGTLVKAYVVIAPDALGAAGGNVRELHASLTLELQAHVKGLLAPYEYPKEIEFVDALPMTTTGKVQRRVLRLQEEARARDAAGDAMQS
jgi:acetyl-CoA synthetase